MRSSEGWVSAVVPPGGDAGGTCAAWLPPGGAAGVEVSRWAWSSPDNTASTGVPSCRAEPGRVMSRSSVHALMALRRVLRGRVFAHDACLFTDRGASLPGYLLEQLPALVADGLVQVEAPERHRTVPRGALVLTEAGALKLAEWERAWPRHVRWLRSRHRAATSTGGVSVDREHG